MAVKKEQKKAKDTTSIVTDLKKKYPNYMKNEKHPTKIYSLDYVLSGGFVRGATYEFASDNGIGKALIKGTPILTPAGFQRIENLKIGSVVFDMNGEETEVKGFYPQGKKDLYKITFSDGTSEVCCKEHLWFIMDEEDRSKGYQVKDAEYLLNNFEKGYHRFSIPYTKPLKFPKRDVRIHPYVLGCLIGSKCIEDKIIFPANFSKEVVDNLLKILPDYTIDTSITASLVLVKNKGAESDLLSDYNFYGLHNDNMFVPMDYLWNDVETRLSLLESLSDIYSFTSALHTGYRFYHIASFQLAEVLCFLARSLGYEVTRKSVVISGTTFYFVRVGITKFSVPLKGVSSSDYSEKFITDVTYFGCDEAFCITVESSTHSYVTGNFTVTHNSTCYLHLARNLVKAGDRVLYLNIEQAPVDSLLVNLGLDKVPSDKFLLLTPTVISEIEEVIEDLVKCTPLYEEPLYNHIMFDSLGAMLPDMLVDRKTCDTTVGVKARQQGDFFTVYTPEFKRRYITTWYVNHLTTKIDTSFHGVTKKDSKGGNTFLYYMDVRFQATSGDKIFKSTKGLLKKEDKDYYANIGKITTVKNKTGQPFMESVFPLFYGKGISNVYFIYEILKQSGYAKILGSWINIPILNPKEPNKQGLFGALEYIRDNQTEIVNKLKSEGLWF